MEYTITGNIKEIFDTQTFPSGFTKREFVVTSGDDKYPQDIKLEFVKERCGMLDAWSKGDLATVYFNIRGNEHNGRYYVNLAAWRMSGVPSEQEPEPEPERVGPGYPPVNEPIQVESSQAPTFDEDEDEIPF